MSDSALPPLEGVSNFRELGGLQARDGRAVRNRRIFRSGHWGRATEADREVMRRLEIAVVFDFRSERDLEHEPADQLPAGVEHVHLPTIDPADATDVRSLVARGDIEALRAKFGEGRAHDYMKQSAARLVTDQTENYSRFLSHLAQPDSPPALFHCSAGKDRAGWAASLLLLALGVEETQVVDHYLLSNVHFDIRSVQAEPPPPESDLAEMLRPLVRVEPEYVGASLEAVRDHFGGLDAYLSDGLRLDADAREQLILNWLEAV